MLKFMCIRRGPNCLPGEWFIGEGVGEPLFRAEMKYSREGAKLIQTGHVALPFETLAAFIIEPGFKISRRLLDQIQDETKTVQELAEFQHEHEDLISPEVEKRGKEANPSILSDKSGVFIDRGKKNDDDS